MPAIIKHTYATPDLLSEAADTRRPKQPEEDHMTIPKLNQGPSSMKHLLASAAFGFALSVSTGTIGLAQEAGSLIVNPVAEQETTPELPTLRETFQSFGSEVDGLNASLRDTRRRHTECLAQAVQAAGEPTAPLQRTRCDISYEASLIDWYMNAETVFQDGAVAMWAQEELLRVDVDQLADQERITTLLLSESQTAEEIALEAARTLYGDIGESSTPEQYARFDELAIAVELARINQDRRQRALNVNEAMAEQSDELRVVLHQTGWGLQSISRRQQVGVANAESRIEQMRDFAIYQERGGHQALPPRLNDLGSVIEAMTEMANATRPDIATIDTGAATNRPTLGLQTGGGYAFFAEIFDETDELASTEAGE
jgi:hypothetical protein